MNAGAWPWHLFEVTGVEVEYMIVDRSSLAVRPVADRLLGALEGAEMTEVECEVEVGDLAWSNELALHVIEFKTNGPTRTLRGLASSLHASVTRANALLEPLGAMLMPTAMHPWMDPHTELRLWPHEYGPVYRAFDRIFGCKGHGWANLQSLHLNLPFADDAEFGRLHAAIRLLLPILPALAASSPVVEGRATHLLDSRLDFYRHNADRIPSVAGLVVPEPVFTHADYERDVLGRIYADMAAHDPEGTLRHEWVNARGCIARFDRGSIEIRVLDVQECPRADMAVAAAVCGVLRALVDGKLSSPEAQRSWPTGRLAKLLLEVMRGADQTRIADADYLRALGWPGASPCSAGELWRHLTETCLDAGEEGREEWGEALETLLDEGCLARRIVARLGGDERRERLAEVYRALCECLARNRVLRADA